MDSSDDEENVIRYGTPLEPIEEDELPSKRKYQQQPDQYAVDDHGRRRFHGAFTGGFSAGFGNTVGTPEGWTPASFKSSRSEKADVSSQKPEDFMDEEDRGEFGIAPRIMQTRSEFSGQKRPRQRQYRDGPIPGEPVLENLVRAVHETAAVRMLRAMGWRPGQGVGDRVSKEERKRASDQHKVYGCYVPPEMRQNTQDQDSDTDSEYDFDALFAPEDYEPYLLVQKNDRFGLGYAGLSRRSVLGSMAAEYGAGAATSHLRMTDKGKKVSIRGQAFGVGAFEADDDDIYAVEDMSHYDFALGASADSRQKKKAKEKGSSHVIEGFASATKPLPAIASHPPPALPRDYMPAPAGARRSRFEPSQNQQRDQGLGRHELTSQARGALLGETPLKPVPDPPDIQTKPTTDPIAQLVGRNVNFVGTSAVLRQDDVVEKTELDYIPITDSGKELTKVFRPFVADPQKQARYERYLKDKTTVELQASGDSLSEWERARELAEFEQAAKLYRPLTGDMGDRFTHASQPDEAINRLHAVAKSTTNYGLATPEQIEAASKGVYGVMTRRQAVWRPEALVYKRFNVPDPGGARVQPAAEDKPKVSYSIFSYLESSVHDKESFAKEQSKFSGSKSLHTDVITKTKNIVNANKHDSNVRTDSFKITNAPQPSTSDAGFNKRMTVAELFLKESEKDQQDSNKPEVTETINKFDKMDLYKSIFLSDSEDDDVETQQSEIKFSFEEYLDKPKNIERNTSPPKGIFSNIDFDEINSWKRNSEKAKDTNEPVNNDKTNQQSKEKSNETQDTAEDTYGPKIPENLKKRLESSEAEFRPVFRSKAAKDDIQEISSSSDSWVDIKEVKSKKQKKKSKKHKSKHKKSKHKKKDR